MLQKQLEKAIADTVILAEASPMNYDYSSESFSSSVGDVLTGLAGYVREATRKLLNMEVRFEADAPITRGEMEGLFGTRKWSEVRDLRCFVPNKMAGKVSAHVELLAELMEEATNIERRLLDPLLRYTAELIASPEDLDKYWNDKDIETVNTDVQLKKLKATFKGENRSGEPYDSTYGKSFANLQDVLEQPLRLKKMFEAAKVVDLDIVMDKEKDLAERVDEIVELVNSGKYKVDTKTMAKLASHVEAASRELEYIAALMYYAKVNLVAFEETYKYNKRMLESK